MEGFSLEYLRAILLLGIMVLIWIILKLQHPYAMKSLECIEGIVEGYAINAAFWSAIVLAAAFATRYYMSSFLHLVMLVLFTKFFYAVTLIEISSTLISIFWGIEKQSNGKLDYRFHMILLFGTIAIVLAVFYLNHNLPTEPISFP